MQSQILHTNLCPMFNGIIFSPQFPAHILVLHECFGDFATNLVSQHHEENKREKKEKRRKKGKKARGVYYNFIFYFLIAFE
jgi:hypothetical protein